MRFAIAAVAVLSAASAANAALLFPRQSYPECALTCVTNPTNLDGCAITDNYCLCRSEVFVATTTLCIENACGPEDTATAEALSRQMCAAVGVTLTGTPTAIPSASSTGTSPSGSGSATTSSPTTTSPVSSSGSASSSAPAASNTSNAASSSGANAFVGVAALVLAALNL